MLPGDTVDAVLAKLGLADRPAPDFQGLSALYAAWCRSVPFDNLVKRIHLASASPAPFPNGTPDGFFDAYLRHGAGGTCWPSSAGLHALLVALGFDARRGSASMFDDIMGPVHTHGTVIVRVDGREYWVDSSMLTWDVLPLVRGADTQLPRQYDRVRAEPVDRLWRVWWTDTIKDTPIGCLLLDDDVSAEHYLTRYEASRDMSPFNTALWSTRATERGKVTLGFGQRFERIEGDISSQPLGEDRARFLVEEFGYSEEIVNQLPADNLVP